MVSLRLRYGMASVRWGMVVVINQSINHLFIHVMPKNSKTRKNPYVYLNYYKVYKYYIKILYVILQYKYIIISE